MKVDFPSSLNMYRASAQAGVKEDKKSSEAARRDVAEFSRGSAAGVDKTLLGAKASIQSEVYAPTGAARVAELKAAVRDGSYHVPTEDIVAAILND